MESSLLRTQEKRTNAPLSKLLAKLLLYPILAGAVFCAPRAQAQELMRESLTGSTPSTASTVSGGSGDSSDYNLRIGPARLSFDVAAGSEYIDNISYSQVNRTSDEVVRLSLNIRTIIPLTRLNTLNFDLGVGFVRYLEHPNATTDDVFITPGSELAFNLYISDFVRINVHDAFDIRQDPVDTAELSNVTNFARFTNTAGVSATIDLRPVVVTAGYDHFNYVSLSSEFDYLNRSAEQFSATVSYQLYPRTFIGVEGGYAITDYDQDVQNDSHGGTAGGFIDTTITPYLRVIVHGGAQFADFDSGGTFSSGPFHDQSSLSTFYWNATINNRLNAYLTQSLSAGRETDLGLLSNYVKVDYVRYNVAWRILGNVTIAGDGFYDHDVESGGLFGEHIDRFGGDVSLGYQFNTHLSGAVHYAYIKKDSDIALRDYYQNRVGLDFDYRF